MSLRIGLRLCLILLLILPIVSIQARPCFAEEAIQSTQGETGLSKRPWQIGVFAQGGFPPDYEIHAGALHYGVKLDLLSAGLEVGKETRRHEGPLFLRGRGEAMLEVMPFWLARYPPQTQTVHYAGTSFTDSSHWDGESFHGASVTPFLLRWNFSQRDSARIVPWGQLGGGLLWTNHKFPYSYFGGTSVINFTPQVGVGVNIFNRPKRSVNLAVKAIHISNAGLGDHNPGLNQTLQFSAGYSWWK